MLDFHFKLSLMKLSNLKMYAVSGFPHSWVALLDDIDMTDGIAIVLNSTCIDVKFYTKCSKSLNFKSLFEKVYSNVFCSDVVHYLKEVCNYSGANIWLQCTW